MPAALWHQYSFGTPVLGAYAENIREGGLKYGCTVEKRRFGAVFAPVPQRTAAVRLRCHPDHAQAFSGGDGEYVLRRPAASGQGGRGHDLPRGGLQRPGAEILSAHQSRAGTPGADAGGLGAAARNHGGAGDREIAEKVTVKIIFEK